MSARVYVGLSRRIEPGLAVYRVGQQVYISGATSLEFELDALLTSMPHPLVLVKPDGATVPGHRSEDFVRLLLGARPTMEAGKLPAQLAPLVVHGHDDLGVDDQQGGFGRGVGHVETACKNGAGQAE